MKKISPLLNLKSPNSKEFTGFFVLFIYLFFLNERQAPASPWDVKGRSNVLPWQWEECGQLVQVLAPALCRSERFSQLSDFPSIFSTFSTSLVSFPSTKESSSVSEVHSGVRLIRICAFWLIPSKHEFFSLNFS